MDCAVARGRMFCQEVPEFVDRYKPVLIVPEKIVPAPVVEIDGIKSPSEDGGITVFDQFAPLSVDL